jgi:hypothetical protein
MTRIAKLLHLAALTAAAALYVAATTQAGAKPPAQTPAQTPPQTPANCGPRDAVLRQLAETFGETRQSVGIGSDNAVVEIFASDETGSWTILVTLPSGVSCLVASGQSFEEVAEALPAKGSDV